MDLPSSAQPLSPEIEFLYGLRGGRSRLGLESTRRLLRLLGSPQNDLVVLQVAGTNGKGTTTALASALLQACGLRVGRFTSPHLLRVEERLCVDGRPIPSESLRDNLRAMRPAIEAAGASFFEAVTALAVRFFQQSAVDVAVVEVGLGGRLDSTTALPAAASVITGVSWDHEAILGDTLSAILTEKLGIVRPGVPVFTGLRDAQLLAQAQRHCESLGSPLHVLSPDAVRVLQLDPRDGMRFELAGVAKGPLHCRFLGEHQARNAALALAAVQSLLRSLPQADVDEPWAGFAQAFLPGRFQLLPQTRTLPETLLDVAHNQQSLHATLDLAQRFFPERRPTVVLGMLRDKRMDGVLERLVGWADALVLTAPVVGRAWDLQQAEQSAVATLGGALPVEAVPRVADAIRAAHERAGDLLIVLGSHYLLGDALPEIAAQRGVAAESLLQPPTVVASS
jgi:dihydrofolate synthase/folylpolyglutamate synthase